MSKDGTSVPECINNSQCREITIDGQVVLAFVLLIYFVYTLSRLFL